MNKNDRNGVEEAHGTNDGDALNQDRGYLLTQTGRAWEVRSSQAEGRLTLGLAGAGPEYL